VAQPQASILLAATGSMPVSLFAAVHGPDPHALVDFGVLNPKVTLKPTLIHRREVRQSPGSLDRRIRRRVTLYLVLRLVGNGVARETTCAFGGRIHGVTKNSVASTVELSAACFAFGTRLTGALVFASSDKVL